MLLFLEQFCPILEQFCGILEYFFYSKIGKIHSKNGSILDSSKIDHFKIRVTFSLSLFDPVKGKTSEK